MVGIFRQPVSAADIKAKARELGADLVGIADGELMNAHPPDAADPRRPSDISELDSKRVIVLAKHLSNGVARIAHWGDRTKFYNDELALSTLEEVSLELVCWLEELGYPAVIIPPTHVDPWRYQDDPTQHMTTLLSLPHAAVEAGLGTLGLNRQLLTPEYGPRVILTAVMCSVEVEADTRREDSLCLGPACGRCLAVCPADAVRHWDRDFAACDTHRSPYGFAKLVGHIETVMNEPDAGKKKALLRTETFFNLWQSILRGSGVVTGCRRCADVCPIGGDYAGMLEDALGHIPEDTQDKRLRLVEMVAREEQGELPQAYEEQRRWIGALGPKMGSNPDAKP
ncbi:Epoxyqueuosine reductase QueG (queuosine biosynthesis) [Rhizobiales bacterium GAS191]|jgi:epoxyqueuosine reductase|nr:Epoxyqueuosine reductase QueG (queuosine biosynthesis) [Rhizobiales bacterium GAS113]SED38185.1 Epoxyqueuosine reductase QueG (queuosine biosynthesis) [Rhizobiales bacterium GAS191]